jgi:flagella basal body P-ring formation protein FlgA
MVPSRPSPAAPAIDAAEVKWAAEEVAALLQQVAPNSVVGMVLTQTLRELASLRQSAGTVVGPFRLKAA